MGEKPTPFDLKRHWPSPLVGPRPGVGNQGAQRVPGAIPCQMVAGGVSSLSRSGRIHLPFAGAPNRCIAISNPVLSVCHPALRCRLHRATVSPRQGGTRCAVTSGSTARRATTSTSSTSACGRRSAAPTATSGSGSSAGRCAACPACDGTLKETEERRRETKAGFATRRDAQAALSKLLVAIEERRHVPKSHLTLKEFLRNDWLPTIASTVRPTTTAHYKCNCEQHIIPVPRVGSRCSASTA